MKEIKSIDRSYQNNKNEVNETDVPKSGFNLTYRNHLGGLVLGRLYPQAFQHTMPNDKISGSNEASLTFEQINTPLIDDMDVCVHNFLVTLRSIDNRWEKFMTPTKLNNMNKNVSVPTFSLSSILDVIVIMLDNMMSLFVSGGVNTLRINITPLLGFSAWDFVYHSDAVRDLGEQIKSFMPTSPIHDFDVDDSDDEAILYQIFKCIFEFFVGKRSLLDYFGYLMVSAEDLAVAFRPGDGVYWTTASRYAATSSNVADWLFNGDHYGMSQTFLVDYDEGDDTYAGLRNYPLQNEYALRAYYAIWFEYYRNMDLEPRSNSLPEYHEFSGTSIFGNPYSINTLHYLVPRIRSWQQDAFTTAGIDDISRHVFAPLLSTANPAEHDVGTELQPGGVIGNTVSTETISWRNPQTGVVSYVSVPMPSRLITALSDIQSFAPMGLELLSLRKAQMLENYLKRIYYGGDEYRDRMLHLYGARIEDYRINRPQWLSSSIDSVTPRQEVANTGVSPEDKDPLKTSIGSRYATATAVQGGNDGFTEFCPEFGIYISLLSIMPHATYDPYILQNMQTAYTDFPIPQFANQMEDVISNIEISRSVSHKAFGYAPYGHAYRYRVDEVHGDYHDNKYDYVFLRFYNEQNIPNLSWSFLHCRPRLPMFVNTILLDGQVYGTFKHNFLVERPLPSPVETI